MRRILCIWVLLFSWILLGCSCVTISGRSGNNGGNVPPGNVTWPPEASYLDVTPERVLDPSYTGPITLTFTFSSAVDNAEVVLSDGALIPLAKQNDYTWTHDFNNTQIFQSYIDGEPRVRAGACNTYNHGKLTTQYNLFIPVRSEAMPDPQIINLSPGMQMSDHVLNIRHDTIYLATSLTGDSIWRTAKEVFTTTLGPRDIYAVVGQVQAFVNRSAGGDELSFPNLGFFDLASKGAIHELGHCLGLVKTRHPLLSGWDHWLPGNAANAIMGWSTPSIVEGLDFRFRLEPGLLSGTTKLLSIPPGTEFNDAELYKLGLIPKNQVAPILQFSDPDKAIQEIQNFAHLPSCGDGCTLVHVPSQYVTIDDIIGTDGETPPAAETQLRLGTVVLSHDRLLTPNEMAYFEYMAARGEGTEPVQVWEGFDVYEGKPFSLATRGLMTLTTRIASNDAIPSGSSIRQSRHSGVGGDPCHAPAAPSSLRAVALSDSAMQLDWQPVPHAALYRIYRSDTADGLYLLLTSIMAAHASYTDIDLRSGTTYHYIVTAVDRSAIGCPSADSMEAGATTLPLVSDTESNPIFETNTRGPSYSK